MNSRNRSRYSILLTNSNLESHSCLCGDCKVYQNSWLSRNQTDAQRSFIVTGQLYTVVIIVLLRWIAVDMTEA